MLLVSSQTCGWFALLEFIFLLMMKLTFGWDWIVEIIIHLTIGEIMKKFLVRLLIVLKVLFWVFVFSLSNGKNEN